MTKSIAYIGVGSNIKPKENIKQALILLQNHFKHIRTSSFYRTKPIKIKTKNDFLNGIWEIKTDINPVDLKLNILLKIEEKLKRIKTTDKYRSRTIDLDLLLYDDYILKNSDISIPDSDIYKRAFLAFPLSELNPDLILPDSNISIMDICKIIKSDDMYIEKIFTLELKKIINKNQQ